MKSWAVPKGPSYDPAVRRLAMEVEDHPLEYNTFEGSIPKGEYGGGSVMLWDRGTYEPEGGGGAEALRDGYERGDLKVVLHGKRLIGGWVLVRMRRDDSDRAQWLLIKHRDETADAKYDVVADEMTSVVTGRTMEEIGANEKRVRRARKRNACRRNACRRNGRRRRSARRRRREKSGRRGRPASRQSRRQDAALAEPGANLVDGARQHSITVGFGQPGIGTFEQGELIGRRIRRERRQPDADQTRGYAARTTQLVEQPVRYLEDHSIGDHRRVERATRLACSKVMVANSHRDRSRGQPVTAQIGRGSRDQREQFAPQLVVVVDVRTERLVAADALGVAVSFDLSCIDSADAVVQPRRLTFAQPLRERCRVVLQYVGHAMHAEPGETFLKARADEWNFGEIKGLEKRGLRTRGDDVHPGRTRAGLRLRALHGEFGDQLRCSAADRHGQIPSRR